MPVSFRRFIPALLLSFLSHAAFAISIPAAADTTTTPRDTLTVAAGKSVVLTVGPTQDALVRFDLSQLPASYNANNVANASLRLYVSRLIKPGDISVHQVIQAWSESVAGPAPEFSATPLATVTADKLATRRFVIVDVTAVVKAWLADPNSNLGLTIISAGTEPTARLTLGSKEGPAVGFPAELQVEIGAGTTNNNLGTSSFIGGGENNLIQSGASFATIPGGMDNEIANNGDFSLAAGRRAVVNHTGSFVWADSTNADFNSTADNQFLIRAANGLTIANDAGGSKVVPVGTRYRDNAIVAWGRVTATGGLDSNFNVATVSHVSTGHYLITLNSSLSSGFSLVPIVTPEVDPDGMGNPLTGAANVRFAVTNQVAAGNTFDIYMYNGSFSLVDNDCQFLVTGR